MGMSISVATVLFFFTVVTQAVPLEHSLNEHSVIRIFVDYSPGFGHASASLNLIDRLRALGYKNKIEVIYQVEAGKKVESLVWEFDAEGLQYFDRERNIEWIPKMPWKPLKLKLAPLAIVGGSDQPLAKSDFNVETLVHLSPLSWLGENSIDSRYGKLNLPEFRHKPFMYYSLNDQQFESWLSFRSKELYHLQARQALSLWWRVKTKVASTLAYEVPNELMRKYLMALRSIKEDRFPDRPLIVLYQSSEQHQNIEYLVPPVLRREVSYIDIQDSSPWQSVDPRKIYILHFKKYLPLNVQGTILRHTEVPPTAAGSNQVNLAMQHGFLPLPIKDGAFAVIAGHAYSLGLFGERPDLLPLVHRQQADGVLESFLRFLLEQSEPGADFFQRTEKLVTGGRSVPYDKLTLALSELERMTSRGVTCRKLLNGS